MAEEIMKNVSISKESVKCPVNDILRYSISLLRIVYNANIPDATGNEYVNNIYLGASDTEPASSLEIAQDNGFATRLFKDDLLDVLDKLVNSSDIPDCTSILKIDDDGDKHQYKNQKYFPLRKKEYSLPDLFHFRTIEGMPPASLDIIDVILFDWNSIRPKRLISLTFKDMPKQLFDKLEAYRSNNVDSSSDWYTISAGL